VGWIDFINETAPEFAKPTREQLGTFIQPTYQALIEGAQYCEPQLREIIARQRPDVVVEDNVVRPHPRRAVDDVRRVVPQAGHPTPAEA
jgi:hypothetical protein